MDPVALLARWGTGVVFGTTLLEQAGLPLPAAPVLVAAGALAQEATLRPEHVALAAVAACLVADHAWFVAGRVRGRALLATVCRISLSPDTCVSKADDLIARLGPGLLVVARFVPGVSAVAIPTLAARGVRYWRFLLFDALGASLWCGAYIGAGMIFSSEVQRVLDFMSNFGGWSMAVVAAIVAAYVTLKFAHRERLRALYRLVRIAPGEVAPLLSQGEALVVDARSLASRDGDPRRIPHSIHVDDSRLDAVLREAGSRTIVTFCLCPNEASAALVAERLMRAGHGRVRVLSGGEEALAMLAEEEMA